MVRPRAAIFNPVRRISQALYAMENLVLNELKMPEAEVTLRLAISLIENNHVVSDVVAAIDGAQVKTGNKVHFPITEFLNSNG